MVWNDQQNSPYPTMPPAAPGMTPAPPMVNVPVDQGIANATNGSVASAPLPGSANVPAYYSGSPLQGQAAQPFNQMAGAAFPSVAAPTSGVTVPAAPMSPLMDNPQSLSAGTPAYGQPAAVPLVAPAASIGAPKGDTDNLEADDVEWVNRTKRAITSSNGDPHRQVQLIQHLRSMYLKERFGRTIHTDEK